VEGEEGEGEGVVPCGGSVVRVQRACVVLRGAERRRVIRE
jgi:hypothetical protein